MSPPSFTPAQVLDCARTIRPFLPELLPAEEAATLDQQLAILLAQAKAGDIVVAPILEALKRHVSTRSWAAEFLSPEPVSKGPGDTQLPGRMSALSAPRYECPEGDYVWYQRSVGSPVQPCPTHPDLDLLGPLE